MATGRAHGATFRSRGADSERCHLICILLAADGSNFRYCPLIQTLDAGYRSRAKCHGPVPNFRALSRAGAGVSDETRT